MLAEADILAAPVAGYAEVVGTEQYATSGVEGAFEHLVVGRFRMPGLALGAPAATPRLPPPLKGEHSRQVLEQFGFSGAKIATLIAEGVVSAGVAA